MNKKPLKHLCAIALCILLLILNTQVKAEPGCDYHAVAELVSRYAWGTDTLDRREFEEVFLPEATVHYVSVGNGAMDLDEQLNGLDEIHGWLVKNLGQRENRVPWRFVTNQIVNIDGNSAKVRAYMHNRVMAAGGIYYIDAVKSEKGWRIKHLRLEEQTWKESYYRPPAN